MVSNLPISSKYRSTPEAAVDEVEREDVAARLNDAFTRGDVSSDDYRALLDEVYAAGTLGELAPVVEKLPAMQTHRQPDLVRQDSHAAPGQLRPAGMDRRMMRMVTLAMASSGLLVLVLLVLAFVFD